MERSRIFTTQPHLLKALKIAEPEYADAVNRIYPEALGSSPKSRIIRNVLLSIYDSQEYKVDPSELNCLKEDVRDACQKVIQAYKLSKIEPHEVMENGENNFYYLLRLAEER